MRILKNMCGWLCCIILIFTASGCSSSLKPMLIDQLIGFATAITGAATTSWIQSMFNGVTSTS